ncbi:MAG: tRNA dihydrouridine synthase DusB [Clostridia bacterium]|nr:tRNA dihydrouridine synthase DusB [Clostridia bacterium]
MAGYTDRAMRLVCNKYGAEYSVTEMVSAKAVVYNDKKTFSLARILDDEGPVSVQIFGSEPEIMAEAAHTLANPADGVPPVAIDINMGCPVNKIFSNGEGSALMKSPELIERITRAVSTAIKIPTTVKIRAGINTNSINAVECALAAEEGGASLICIHGRTREQMYGGLADREIIKNVKSALHIPLIANGDIVDGESAIAMLRDTGADGIAIGRGAVGNPFIFSEIISVLENREYTPPTIEERIDTALLQLRTAIEEKGERMAIPEARKQIALYLRSFHGAARIRAEINRATCFDQVAMALRSALDG